MAWKPDPADVAFYRERGYLIASGLFCEEELARMDRAILRLAQRPECRSTDRKSRYPQPSKYTIGDEGLLDPDLSFIAEHPLVVDAVETLLHKQAYLSASVSYLRTPNDTGSVADYQGSSQTAHCDYKPFRPAGSSLDWLFTILALVDFSQEIGPLYVSPGSHLLPHRRTDGRIERVQRAQAGDIPPLVDAELKRGDLLFMNMFTWHEAPPNRSNQDRWGVFNKYMAIDAPPACGPFLFPQEAHERFGPVGRRLTHYHSDRPIAMTRLILDHGGRALLVADGGRWTLPGGEARQIDVIRDWDLGNVIACLEQLTATQLGIEIDWMTYVADFPEGEGLCRVYAHQLDEGPALDLRPSSEWRWVGPDDLGDRDLIDNLLLGFEADALQAWWHDGLRRGIGESQQRAGLKAPSL